MWFLCVGYFLKSSSPTGKALSGLQFNQFLVEILREKKETQIVNLIVLKTQMACSTWWPKKLTPMEPLRVWMLSSVAATAS
jgi:hypothetical protein